MGLRYQWVITKVQTCLRINVPNLAVQSVILRLAALALHGNLLGMQNFRPHAYLLNGICILTRSR